MKLINVIVLALGIGSTVVSLASEPVYRRGFVKNGDPELQAVLLSPRGSDPETIAFGTGVDFIARASIINYKKGQQLIEGDTLEFISSGEEGDVCGGFQGTLILTGKGMTVELPKDQVGTEFYKQCTDVLAIQGDYSFARH